MAFLASFIDDDQPLITFALILLDAFRVCLVEQVIRGCITLGAYPCLLLTLFASSSTFFTCALLRILRDAQVVTRWTF